MKSKTPWIILAVVLMIIALFLMITKEPPFKTISFSNKNQVKNLNRVNYLDTITHIGLKKLNLIGINLVIRDMKEDIKIGEYDVKAFIIGDNSQYAIYTKFLINRTKSIEVISHELIHLLQSEVGKFKKGDTYIIWDNDTIHNPGDLDYSKRPWEIEAFDLGKLLEYEIRNELIQ
jgi:hypothetical protein